LLFGNETLGYGPKTLHVAEWAKWDVIHSAQQHLALGSKTLGTVIYPDQTTTAPDWYMPLYNNVTEQQAGLSTTNSGGVLVDHPTWLLSRYIPAIQVTKTSGVTGHDTTITLDNVTPTASPTYFQIFRESQDVSDKPTQTNPYPVTIRHDKANTYANISSATPVKLVMWLPLDQQFKIRYKFGENGSWSDTASFTSTGYVNSFQRYLSLSGLSTEPVVINDTSSGATAINQF